jgi:hypothetical protein
MDTDEDVLLGMETWPVLFPGSEVLNCLGTPSSITSAPSRVQYHHTSRVHKVTSTVSFGKDEQEDSSAPSVEAMIDPHVDEKNLIELGSVDATEYELNSIWMYGEASIASAHTSTASTTEFSTLKSSSPSVPPSTESSPIA